MFFAKNQFKQNTMISSIFQLKIYENLRFKNSIIVTNKPAIPNNAKGIQIPNVSANTPLRIRKTVQNPN